MSFLIKHSERALIAMEARFPEEARLFTAEPGLTEANGPSHWSYGFSFRLLFWCAGIGGLLSAFAALVRASGATSAG